MQRLSKEFEEIDSDNVRRGYRLMSRKSASCQVVNLQHQAPQIK